MTLLMRVALTVTLLALALAAPAEAKDVVVYVCGKDLCRVAPDGTGKQRLTRDGGYSRPSISRTGRRLAFRRGSRVYTARVAKKKLKGVRRIGPAPDGPADATQFDVAISRDGRRVLWVELRINALSRTIDYRRYASDFDGSGIEQVAASGGRPFVGWFDSTRILREGLADSVEGRPDATTVDQGLCVPDPESEQNGTCGDHGPQAAFDPQARHLRHPHVSADGRRLVATAYRSDEQIDSTVEKPGQLLLFDVASALPVRELTPGPRDLYPSFSPDGKRVIFERARSASARSASTAAASGAWSRASSPPGAASAASRASVRRRCRCRARGSPSRSRSRPRIRPRTNDACRLTHAGEHERAVRRDPRPRQRGVGDLGRERADHPGRRAQQRELEAPGPDPPPLAGDAEAHRQPGGLARPAPVLPRDVVQPAARRNRSARCGLVSVSSPTCARARSG